MSLLTLNALTASDQLIIPVQAPYLAMRGMAKLMQVVSKVQQRLNTDLKIAGVLITQYDGRKNPNKSVSELVQETLLAVWQKAALYHPDRGAPTTWIYTVMRNQCFDMLRRQQVSKEDLVAEDIWPVLEYQAVEDDANDPGENDILTRQLMHYLHLLPLPQQEVVRSVYLQDQTLQEISDRLQVPLGTIKSRLRLGLMKLREQIDQEREYD